MASSRMVSDVVTSPMLTLVIESSGWLLSSYFVKHRRFMCAEVSHGMAQSLASQ